MSATPRLRRAALTAAALALASGAIELLALGAHGVVFGELLSFEAAQNARLSLIPLEQVPLGSPGRARDGQAPAEDDENNAQALHPYVGYVLDPNRSPNWPVNEYGFLGAGPPFGEDDAGAISIAIVGGSVAENLALFAQDALVAELAAIEAFRGRKLRVSCLALRGMKQPQQLLVIDWFLSLGARFDIVINLDGFNEVVLSGENALQGTFPFYPRRWRVRMQGLPDLQLAALAGEIRFLDELRAGLAQRFVGAPQRWSVTANVVWRLADRRLRSERDTVSAALNRRLLEDTTPAADDAYQTDGPKRSYADAAARHSDLARYWARASRLLQQRAQAAGFRYFHFLQPNQYVPGSKTFTPEERAIALPGTYYWRDDAEGGYGALVAQGRSLAAAGVPFTDLTMMFQDTVEPVYSDACCHFNGRGYERIARAIGERVRAAWADAPRP